LVVSVGTQIDIFSRRTIDTIQGFSRHTIDIFSRRTIDTIDVGIDVGLKLFFI